MMGTGSSGVKYRVQDYVTPDHSPPVSSRTCCLPLDKLKLELASGASRELHLDHDEPESDSQLPTPNSLKVSKYFRRVISPRSTTFRREQCSFGDRACLRRHALEGSSAAHLWEVLRRRGRDVGGHGEQ